MSRESDIPGLEAVSVDVDGVRWHCRVGGEGPPVVLLHGWPETGWTFRHVVPSLLRKRRVYVPDLPGWGASDKPADYPYGVPDLVEKVPLFARAAGIDGRFALVGHDWGAAAAIFLTLRRPEILERAVWINLGPELLSPFRPVHIWFMNLPLLPERVLARRPRGYLERIFRWWAADGTAFGPDVIDAYAAAFEAPGAREATLRYYRSVRRMAAKALAGRLRGTATPRQVKVPLLVLWGDRDPIAPIDDAHALARKIPSAIVQPILGAGHFPQEERPDQVIRAFDSFL